MTENNFLYFWKIEILGDKQKLTMIEFDLKTQISKVIKQGDRPMKV
jgi:hypothetical protein